MASILISISPWSCLPLMSLPLVSTIDSSSLHFLFFRQSKRRREPFKKWSENVSQEVWLFDPWEMPNIG